MNSDLGNKEIFSYNLNYYMAVNNKTRNKLCEDLKIPYSTLSDWLNCHKYPRIDKIDAIAKYFNIKKSDLIEDHSKIAVRITPEEFYEEVYELLKKTEGIDENDRNMIAHNLKYFCNKGDK